MQYWIYSYKPLEVGVAADGMEQLKIPKVVGMFKDVGILRDVGRLRDVGILRELASPSAWDVKALLRAVLERPREAAEKEGMGRLLLLKEDVLKDEGRPELYEVGRLAETLVISFFI